MSKAAIIEFKTIPELGHLNFSEIEKILNEKLKNLKTKKEFESIIMAINPLIRANDFSEFENSILKKIRQKAYYKRQNSKNYKMVKPKNYKINAQ